MSQAVQCCDHGQVVFEVFLPGLHVGPTRINPPRVRPKLLRHSETAGGAMHPGMHRPGSLLRLPSGRPAPAEESPEILSAKRARHTLEPSS